MFKKLLYILPIYLAFAIVMAHSIVPHHHDHEVGPTEHHHYHNDAGHHHDEDENKDSDLAHGFEFFQHAGNTIEFISSQFSLAKILSSFQIAVFIQSPLFDIRPCESPHILFGFSSQKNLYSFLFPPQTSLRAPPCIG